MRPRYATDIDTLKREVEIETFRSSKPGGQHKDKTETAVRLRHIPSGVAVVASEHRSQAMNRRLAFQRLREKLERLNRRKKPRIATRPPARALENRSDEKARQSHKKNLRGKVDPSDLP